MIYNIKTQLTVNRLMALFHFFFKENFYCIRCSSKINMETVSTILRSTHRFTESLENDRGENNKGGEAENEKR